MAPIRESERDKYPPRGVWRKIREAVLERAGHLCEFCGVPNYEIILSEREGGRKGWYRSSGTGEAEALEGVRVTKVVLTTAHLDHDPGNNDGFEETGAVLPVPRSNLRALCQHCHNNHDRAHRNVNAADTRARRKRELDDVQGQGRLFDLSEEP